MVCNGFKGGNRRVGMGLGKLGNCAGNGSGDLFLALTTANTAAGAATEAVKLEMRPNTLMDLFFRATIEATEEAVMNTMLAAPAISTGVDGSRVYGLPGPRLVGVQKKYGRIRQINRSKLPLRTEHRTLIGLR